MKYYLFQTVREYFLSALLAAALFSMLPLHYVADIQNITIKMISFVPVDFISILTANLLTMIFIFACGLFIKTGASFFAVINGTALGIVISVYKNNLAGLFGLLFFHSIFEISLIIIFCSFVKVINACFRTRDRDSITKYIYYMILICAPLWLISAIIETL